MPRVLTQAVRLLKFGAVAGALVGVSRLMIKRKRRSEMGESSWPTIAETAAQNGQPIDDESGAKASEPSADAAGDDADAEQTDCDGSDDGDDKA